MLFEPGLLHNPWKRSVPTFFSFNILTLGAIWIAFDIAGEEKDVINKFLMAIPIFSVFLFLIGLFINDVPRVKYFVLILGIFGVVPIFISCLVPFVVFLIISKYSFFSKLIGLGIYFLALVFSSFKNAINVKVKEERIGYLDRQISNYDENYFCIDIRKMREIDFYVKKRPVGKIQGKIILKLIPIAALGYPLQRLITDVGGHVTIMAFLSILSVPLSLYIAGRVAGGYMLWVYLIGSREKKLGAPIFFK